MFQFARAVKTKYQYQVAEIAETDSLRSGGWKSDIKVSSGLISSKASLLSYGRKPVCVSSQGRGGSLCACLVLISSCKDTSHIGLGPIQPSHLILITISFNLNYVFQVFIPRYSHSQGTQFRP